MPIETPINNIKREIPTHKVTHAVTEVINGKDGKCPLPFFFFYSDLANSVKSNADTYWGID